MSLKHKAKERKNKSILHQRATATTEGKKLENCP